MVCRERNHQKSIQKAEVSAFKKFYKEIEGGEMNKPEIRKFIEWLKKKNIELIHVASWLRLTEKGLDNFLDEYMETEK